MPWQTHFPEVGNWEAPLEIITLPELLSAGVEASGDASAIDFRNTKISYLALAREVEGLASGLTGAGVRRWTTSRCSSSLAARRACRRWRC